MCCPTWSSRELSSNFNRIFEGKGLNGKEIWERYAFKLQLRLKLNESVFEFWEQSTEKKKVVARKGCSYFHSLPFCICSFIT